MPHISLEPCQWLESCLAPSCASCASCVFEALPSHPSSGRVRLQTVESHAYWAASGDAGFGANNSHSPPAQGLGTIAPDEPEKTMNNNEIQTNKDKLGITSRSRSEFCDDVGMLSSVASSSAFIRLELRRLPLHPLK